MELSAKGLRVIVTAGGAGIGRAIAQTFLEAGARVHTCDVDPRTKPDTLADVANLADVEKLFREAHNSLGGPDVLVDNSGMSGGGSIVNLSCAAGRHGFPQRSPYSAAKWGVASNAPSRRRPGPPG